MNMDFKLERVLDGRILGKIPKLIRALKFFFYNLIMS